ncbi:hypothetical protein T484DRAFT_2985501 [Baffinella frigidus]|nr:hypothetical protein T484DRAFT_2985501 [Cryptophyta sp. CCMP2293]
MPLSLRIQCLLPLRILHLHNHRLGDCLGALLLPVRDARRRPPGGRGRHRAHLLVVGLPGCKKDARGCCQALGAIRSLESSLETLERERKPARSVAPALESDLSLCGRRQRQPRGQGRGRDGIAHRTGQRCSPVRFQVRPERPHASCAAVSAGGGAGRRGAVRRERDACGRERAGQCENPVHSGVSKWRGGGIRTAEVLGRS